MEKNDKNAEEDFFIFFAVYLEDVADYYNLAYLLGL